MNSAHNLADTLALLSGDSQNETYSKKCDALVIIANDSKDHFSDNLIDLVNSDKLVDMASLTYPLLFLNQVVIALIILFFAQRFIRKDYHDFLELGPGGTPSTPRGYLRICFLKIFALRYPLVPPPIPATLRRRGFLMSLSPRKGSRPKVAGLAPQRQKSQKIGPENYANLVAAIRKLAAEHPSHLFLGTSCFEKHSEGIFSVPVADPTKGCGGEVCHSHPSDGSMHLTLHPADVKLVLEQGWGERHPLARENWWWRLKVVPSGFVMIYAPRDQDELNTVTEIIRAAAGWIGGRALKGQ